MIGCLDGEYPAPGRPVRRSARPGRRIRLGCGRRRVEPAGGERYLPGMADAVFDTLAVTRQLKAKGFDADQAEAITEAVRTGVTGGVATKADLAETEHRLRGELTALENRLTWRILIVGLALNGTVIAAVGWMLSGS